MKYVNTLIFFPVNYYLKLSILLYFNAMSFGKRDIFVMLRVSVLLIKRSKYRFY